MYWDTKNVTLVELVLICTTILCIREDDSRVVFLFYISLTATYKTPYPPPPQPSHSLSTTALVTKQI